MLLSLNYFQGPHLEKPHGIAGYADNGPAEGASYWASLLSEFASQFREGDQDDLNKGLRKTEQDREGSCCIGRYLPTQEVVAQNKQSSVRISHPLSCDALE